MFKVKAVAAVAMALAAAGAAQAVQVDAFGRGQVLLAPYYSVVGGTTSTIKVVNTDTTSAVKAKLVLRSKDHSRECRDVILYLSPGDVAEVKLNTRTESASHANIFSDDDSLLSGVDNGLPVFASTVGRPYTSTTVNNDWISTDDSCAEGHIEVFGAYRASGTVQTAAGPVRVFQGMTKGDLYKIFVNDPADLRARNPITSTTGTVTSNNVNSLTGTVDIQFPTASRDHATVPFTALRSTADAFTGNPDLISNQVLSTGSATGKPFDVVPAAATNIGLEFFGGFGDSLPQIEAALGATNVHSSYQRGNGDRTDLLITFPTRYRYLTSRTARTYSPPFRPNGAYEWSVASFDMKEGSPTVNVVTCFQSPCDQASSEPTFLTREVNYFITTDAFWFDTKGWFNVTLTPFVSTGAAGSGRPASVLAYTNRVKIVGDSVQSVVTPMNR